MMTLKRTEKEKRYTESKLAGQAKLYLGQVVVYSERGKIKELVGKRCTVVRMEETRGGIVVRFGPEPTGRLVTCSPYVVAVPGKDGALRWIPRPQSSPRVRVRA